MFGLQKTDIEVIQRMLEQFNEIEKAFIFGSRAIGNFKKGSDIDIAVSGKNINENTLTKLFTLLNEESPLPYFFDLLHYEEISNSELKMHIDNFGVEIYNNKTSIV
ncbi:nucleotidyltransferase family protein [Alkalicoccus daliensis]|uniref:Predicted nucleotidyltransferase n=1 Tax=Alkalicoccus daliensis TaxID=745820 RepID=A0A1H0GAZ0_9BACI|nr:nucleotidyltransferase domain-containing protein [Alkalicoccus daliensis]SDO04052.1 Predicted nucleotidyltransferase [Alkalicoccus daliensis]